MPRLMIPTDEQLAILDAVVGRESMKIKAYAGAGKTSTLRLVADRLSHQRGIYLAFNREIAEHAKRRFPGNVLAGTIHSMAYRSVSTSLTARVNQPAEQPHELAARYGLGPVEVPLVTGKVVEVTPFELGRMIVDGLGRFCRSADDVPLQLHIPVDEKIDVRAAEWLQSRLVPYVERLWSESKEPSGRGAILPDVYLKVWAQSGPRIESDFILLDEAQDSDGAILRLLDEQTHAQIVYVGDPYQQIYEWRGAVNAMAKIEAAEYSLTESFRFGHTFALLASRLLALLGEQTPVRGQGTIGSLMVEDPSVAPPVDAILCRKNVSAIWHLAAGVEAGQKPAIRMSPAEIVAYADGADMLLAGRRAFRPAALSLFETWKDVQSFARSAAGVDLLPIVRIVDELGTDYLRSLALRITPEASADYIISTVHRAKGLEWKRVKVVNDFLFKYVDGRLALDDDELRLLYVALTRAQHVLDVSDLREPLLKLFA
ncbi:UvrD-helicase domain-containing protein [Paraburkholderia sabiae]|uniref:UvrD-helicase domain-containing protein n=1 Tax=Paraburkholderia sabiae TaxID=273251 RepID=A0ABU9QLY2_9BURK|nr:UvrD-helicase domain-containing protein [Paraburkholderia sabiae]WJZ79987.1 AAA family ATPase [Paraburkholderia sabiae]CAD6561188.1 ATP-dependent DNA helicase Rep [Paraburkholderia sabiae]